MPLENLSPEVMYALKPNIAFPGSMDEAVAAETAAQTRLADGFPTLTITVPSGAISGKLAQ